METGRLIIYSMSSFGESSLRPVPCLNSKGVGFALRCRNPSAQTLLQVPEPPTFSTKRSTPDPDEKTLLRSSITVAVQVPM